MDHNNQHPVLRQQANWKKLYFYQKADTLYQLTFVFCKRFLPAHGDRTVDQMVQAARSGKQNIVEGSEDGKTSTEMELRLLNVSRASLHELREDYEDYARTRHLEVWRAGHPRYDGMVAFCKRHNTFEEYAPFIDRWGNEEFCNTALSLCHITDRMMSRYLERLEKEFVEHGGIKERMHAARTGYRQEQDRLLKRLKEENDSLRRENDNLRRLLSSREH